MNDTYIVTAYSIIADLLTAYGYQDDVRSTISAAEVMIVAVVAAKYFQNHHERALSIMVRLGDIPPLTQRIAFQSSSARRHQTSLWQCLCQYTLSQEYLF